MVEDVELEDDEETVDEAHGRVPPLSPHIEECNKDVEEHIDREVDSVAEGAVDAVAGLVRRDHPQDLEERVTGHKSRSDQGRLPPLLPEPLIQDR